MDFRSFFDLASSQTVEALNRAISSMPLKITSTFDFGHKTVSEIGGRFIEEYVTQNLSSFFENNADFQFEYLPSRSLGDYKIQSRINSQYVLYVDIKAQHLTIREETEKYYKENGIAQKKPGESHPNLISYEKAKNFYGDSTRVNEDIAILTVKYAPAISGKTVDFKIQQMLPENLFLLRTLSEGNLSFSALGRGQIQLSRLNSLAFQDRNKEQFLELVESIASRPRGLRGISST